MSEEWIGRLVLLSLGVALVVGIASDVTEQGGEQARLGIAATAAWVGFVLWKWGSV